MDAMVADHERSTGPWEIEWVALPEVFCLIGRAEAGAVRARGLEVDAPRMRKNLEMTNGLVMSEAVMMGLGRYIGREYAHDLVYDLCREALQQDRPLIDLLAAHPEIKAHVDRAELERWLDPINGTRTGGGDGGSGAGTDALEVTASGGRVPGDAFRMRA